MPRAMERPWARARGGCHPALPVPGAPVHAQGRQTQRPSMMGEGVEEPVGRARYPAPGRAEHRGDGGEDHEEVEREGRLVSLCKGRQARLRPWARSTRRSRLGIERRESPRSDDAGRVDQASDAGKETRRRIIAKSRGATWADRSDTSTAAAKMETAPSCSISPDRRDLPGLVALYQAGTCPSVIVPAGSPPTANQHEPPRSLLHQVDERHLQAQFAAPSPPVIRVRPVGSDRQGRWRKSRRVEGDERSLGDQSATAAGRRPDPRPPHRRISCGQRLRASPQTAGPPGVEVDGEAAPEPRGFPAAITDRPRPQTGRLSQAASVPGSDPTGIGRPPAVTTKSLGPVVPADQGSRGRPEPRHSPQPTRSGRLRGPPGVNGSVLQVAGRVEVPRDADLRRASAARRI